MGTKQLETIFVVPEAVASLADSLGERGTGLLVQYREALATLLLYTQGGEITDIEKDGAIAALGQTAAELDIAEGAQTALGHALNVTGRVALSRKNRASS